MDAIALLGSVGGAVGQAAALNGASRPAPASGDAVDVNTAALKLIQAAIVGTGQVLDVQA